MGGPNATVYPNCLLSSLGQKKSRKTDRRRKKNRTASLPPLSRFDVVGVASLSHLCFLFELAGGTSPAWLDCLAFAVKLCRSFCRFLRLLRLVAQRDDFASPSLRSGNRGADEIDDDGTYRACQASRSAGCNCNINARERESNLLVCSLDFLQTGAWAMLSGMTDAPKKRSHSVVTSSLVACCLCRRPPHIATSCV